MKGLLFTYLLSYGGAFASLLNPFIGFLIYVCFAIIRPEALWHFSVPASGNYSRIVAIGLLVGWAVHGFGNWNLGKARGIAVCLALYWLWSLVSALTAVASVEAGLSQFEAYSKVFLPFFVGLTTIRTMGQIKALVWVIVLCQGFLAYEFNQMYWYSPWFIASEWTFAGSDNNCIAITMVTSAGLAFFLGLYAQRWWQKLIALAAAGAMVHVVLFSMSRGGMMALIVTGVVTFILIPKRPVNVLVFVLALCIGLRLAGPSVWERFNQSFADNEGVRDGSAQERLDLWKTCIRVMLEYPFTGIGPQNWRLIAHHYGFPPGKDAHTTWLHVGAEMGIVGLAFLLSFYGFACGKLWALKRQAGYLSDPWFQYVACMVIASIAGFAVSAQFVSSHGVELPFYIVLAGAATLKLADQPAEIIRATDDTDPTDVRRWLAVESA